ncbi:glycerol-3-phosphate 1-O-acyltransferase [Coriobacteriales bacterium OH1046]|nr:glycerol-3-phosphate 1-O-acyltransferase [Coriobacteriales bacterium OH1046]
MPVDLLHAAILPTVLCCGLSYLLCGIPFGLLIARLRGVDVRKVGSGNIGTTNVARSVGAAASALTLILDAGKGFVSLELARHLIPWMAEREFKVFDLDQTAGVAIAIVYVACICGHIFSPYLGLKGGKGIAVGFGAALSLDWRIALGLLVVFILVAVPTRYVSLASCSAALSLPPLALAFGSAPVSMIPLTLVAALVIWAHRSNIKKLLDHEEKRFAFHAPDRKM